MGIQGNSFELLGFDGGDDLESLIARAAVKIEPPPSAVEKLPNKNKKPLPSSQLPPQFQSRPPRSSDRARSESGGDTTYGTRRPLRNGAPRYNNHDTSFRQNNGFRQEHGRGDRLKHFDSSDKTAFRKDESETDGNVRLHAGRSNPLPRTYAGDQQKHRVAYSAENEVDRNLQAPRQGYGFRRDRGFGQRRGYNVNRVNGNEEVVVDENKQQSENQGHKDGRSNGDLKNANKSNDYGDERPHRSRNWNSGERYARNNAAFHGGYKRGGSDEGKNSLVRRGDRGDYQGFRNENTPREKNDGKINELKDSLLAKSSEKDDGVEDADTGIEGNAANAEVSQESEFKKERRGKVLSPEALAEEEAEAQKMTLKEYEKHLQEKNKALVSMKTEERKVAPDEELESMQIIVKKNEESIFVRLGNDKDKLKKKPITDKDENTAHKVLVPNFKHAGTDYNTGRRNRGRYPGREENGDGVYSGRGDHGGARDNGYLRHTNRAKAPPSIEDSKQFPALGAV